MDGAALVVEAPPPEPEAVEAVSDAAVEIEQIRADAAVAQAAVAAEAAVQIAEAESAARIAEASPDEDMAWLQNEFARLHARLDSQAEVLATLAEQHRAMLERLETLASPPPIPPTSEAAVAVATATPETLPPEREDGPRESPVAARRSPYRKA